MSVEVVSAIIAVLSAIVSAYFANEARKSDTQANGHAKKANDIAVGQAENELRRDITAARIRYEDASAAAEEVVQGRTPDKLTEADKLKLRQIQTRQKSACEDYLNAYENACTKYIDGKIDRDRFEKSYASEIRNLFEPPTNAFAPFLHPEGVSRFKALWKVYRSWNDLENRP